MAVSVNSVIHYTKTLDSLKSILADAFRIKFCLEKVTGVDSAFPMVSFCDIPLSQIKEHMKDYGSYGIGLTKEWAGQNNLNPVLYINKNSYLDLLLIGQGKKIDESVRSGEKDAWSWLEQFISILSFVKGYKGRVTINGKEEERIFYNEREWRYVPSRSELKINNSLPQIYGPTYISRKEAFNKTLSNMRLKFSIDDISYLIVDTDSDVHELVNHIKVAFVGKSERQIELLITKIFTKQQILEDF